MRSKTLVAVLKQRFQLESEKCSFEIVNGRVASRKVGSFSRIAEKSLHRLEKALVELKQLEYDIESSPPCTVFGVDITTRNIGRFAAAMSTGLLYTIARTR